jgi:hypothetical protein
LTISLKRPKSLPRLELLKKTRRLLIPSRCLLLRVESHLSLPPGVYANEYRLIQLSVVGDRKISETLDARIGTVNEVLPTIEELNDRSWEILYPDFASRLSYRTRSVRYYPGSDVDFDYDPPEFTDDDDDLRIWDYDMIKEITSTMDFFREQSG